MALIDFDCLDDTCEGELREFPRRAVDWQVVPPCPTCAGPMTRVFLPPRTTWSIDPIVVFQASDGSYRFPGDSNGVSVKQYEREGMTRVELRSAADVRSFEKKWNDQERSRGERRVEAEHCGRSMRESGTRAQLFQAMKTFSNMGRDVAHEAIARGNARPQPRAHDPGCHVEAFSYNRGNRGESRGSDGRRRRD